MYERVMFWLFVCGGISFFLLPKVLPFITTRTQLGFYDIVGGISDMSGLWLIIWLLLRAKRIRRNLQD